MNRIPEPELMTDPEQARAYAAADFTDANNRFVDLLRQAGGKQIDGGRILDLGCGPGGLVLQMAEAFPRCHIHGLDGSAEMLRLAATSLARNPHLADRVGFRQGTLPGVDLGEGGYDIITSNSLLHHLHDPRMFWNTIKRLGKPGALVFVMDLFRPPDARAAAAIVDRWSAGEAEILRRDFFNSLCAAFEVAEVRSQLEAAGLFRLTVTPVSDRHLTICGRL